VQGPARLVETTSVCHCGRSRRILTINLTIPLCRKRDSMNPRPFRCGFSRARLQRGGSPGDDFVQEQHGEETRSDIKKRVRLPRRPRCLAAAESPASRRSPQAMEAMAAVEAVRGGGGLCLRASAEAAICPSSFSAGHGRRLLPQRRLFAAKKSSRRRGGVSAAVATGGRSLLAENRSSPTGVLFRSSPASFRRRPSVVTVLMPLLVLAWGYRRVWPEPRLGVCHYPDCRTILRSHLQGAGERPC